VHPPRKKSTLVQYETLKGSAYAPVIRQIDKVKNTVPGIYKEVSYNPQHDSPWNYGEVTGTDHKLMGKGVATVDLTQKVG